jgi:predicted enzyme related to lactoylglutathione lyase
MHEQEAPTVRSYVRVAQIHAAVEHAVGAGATLALEPTEIPGRGTIAIYMLGGIQQGLWQTS